MTTSRQNNGSTYATIWRWHFYAGLFIAPILIALAITGLGMMLFANVTGRHGELVYVNDSNQQASLTEQTHAVQQALPDAKIIQYISPKEKNQVSLFRVSNKDESLMVAVNPHTAQVINTYPRGKAIYDLMDDFHGSFLIGKVGDYIIETGASLCVLMILSGWYLWWVNQRSIRKSFFPKLSRKKTGKNTTWWKNTHGATGAWVSLVLFFFLVSGLSWAGIWGGKLVQAWSQFPAGKWGNPPVPTSSHLPTHGEVLNPTGPKEVPWVLELTPMPQSNSNQPKKHISLETLDAFAKENTVDGRYHLHFPKGDKGVWSITQDSMSYDSGDPMADRTIHIDQYSGKVLADIRFDDYNFFGKFMAIGIALHMGSLGWWSILANTVFCLAVIFMCIGGLTMWWKRRPSTAVGLAPPKTKNTRISVGFALILLVTALLFPTALIAITVIFVLDFTLFSHLSILQRILK